MESPRSVVIPFGVPDEGRGLGLGLAALVHAFVHLDGQAVAIAQLQARPSVDRGPAEPSVPVEAFVSPAAWRDIAGRGDGPAHVGVVLTGSFEPPAYGQGAIRLLAFEPASGRTRASIDAAVDGERAGAALVAAIEDFGDRLGGKIGAIRAIRELAWEPLESVLYAERCALHDPGRSGPHDPLAAMLHLGRAIGDAPTARYPVERLCAVALEAGAPALLDGKLGAAALRALERATSDAPGNVELLEAYGVLLIRLGDPRRAEQHLNEAVALEPSRPKVYASLAHALRVQGKVEAAMAVLAGASRLLGEDPALLVERGTALAALGDVAGAGALWWSVLARDPVHPGAFVRAAAAALRARDEMRAQVLIDSALAAPCPGVEVLRTAAQLALEGEAEGIARAARVRRLAERWVERAPGDASGYLVLAHALLALGEKAAAAAALDVIARLAPKSPACAEALALRLGIEAPDAEVEVQSVLRAASAATADRLPDVASRARRLAAGHASWPAWLAAALAEQRVGRWSAARRALEAALEIAPGAPRVHAVLAEVLLELGDNPGAVAHAQTALRLDGPSPAKVRLLARALAADRRVAEAIDVARRALALDAEDSETLSLVRDLQARFGEGHWRAALERRIRHVVRTLRRSR